MSVVSERSSRRPSHQRPRPRPLGGRGRGYSQSDVGGCDPLIIPQFSAIASEGLKRPSLIDEWADNTTMITGNTSEHSFCMEENKQNDLTVGRLVVRRCSRVMWLTFSTIICLCAFISAPLMIAIPFILHHFWNDWPPITCELDCQGNLFDLAFKTVFLIIAQLAMYYRRATADLPRLYFSRAAITLLVLFELFGFWLFYFVRIFLERQAAFIHITNFALSLINALLCTHYLSLIILELRKHRKEYYISIVRDPDGESGTMMIGNMSLQEAATQVLRHYHANFPSFNVYLDKSRYGPGRMKSFDVPGIKMYNIEGIGGHDTISEQNARALMEAMARRRVTGHAELYQKEQDWENRYNKRKYRLLASSEDAFAQVQPVNANKQGPRIGEMDLRKTAESVYSWVAKPLSKFLKVTRQLERNSPEQVKDHIERCLALKLNYRTFVQRFTSPRFPEKQTVAESKWSLSCGWPASASVDHGVSFSLRCHDPNDDIGVQLICTISSIPFYNLTEQSALPPQKFTLRVAHDMV